MRKNLEKPLKGNLNLSLVLREVTEGRRPLDLVQRSVGVEEKSK